MNDYSRQIATGKDTFHRIAKEAGLKANGNIFHLMTKAVMGGWMVALGGYAACFIASLYHTPNTTNATAKAAFAMVFPAALVCIMFTGSDLYTGNTMCFTFALINRQITPLTFLIKLMVSIAGNFIGATLGAAILAGGTGHFLKGHGAGAVYMMEMAKAKTSMPFWRLMLSAIGCNSLVCLAVWTFYASYDASGGVLNIFSQIGAFAVGGLEHTIANFYLLNAALISRSGVTFVDVYFRNLVPVCLGNTIAGIFFIGVPLSFLYNETPGKDTLMMSQKLEDEAIIISA